MEKVLILKSKAICYNSTIYFADLLAKRIKNYEVEIFDFSKQNPQELENYIGKKFKAIIDFNSKVPKLQMEETDEYFLDKIDAPFYNYILDHPLYHHDTLKIKLKNYNVICLDNNHKEYIKKYYSHIKDIVMKPIITEKISEIKPYNHRSIDILFTGTYTNPKAVKKIIDDYPVELKEGMNKVIDIMLKNSDLTQEEALIQVLGNMGFSIEGKEEKFANLMNIYFLVDTYINAYNRELVIKKIIENDLKLTVVGHNWENFECKNKENLIIKGEVDFKDIFKYYADAKVSLNIMPGFKDGSHDRVYSSILNGAICVTDKSKYLEEKFKNSKEVIFYSLKELEKLPQILKEKIFINNF